MLDLVYNIEEVFRFCGSAIGTVVVNLRNSMNFVNDCIYNLASFAALLPSWIQNSVIVIISATLISKLARLKG